MVPTMVHRLLASDLGLHGLALLVGGADLDDRGRPGRERRGARIVSTYGLTETCGGVAYDGVPSRGRRCAWSRATRSRSRARRRWRAIGSIRPATGAAFTTDGWLRTGDLGTIGEDGVLSVHGRPDDVIRSGAEKIWPEEVERALPVAPKGGDVAVAGQPATRSGARM